jgi:hypothetical protein
MLFGNFGGSKASFRGFLSGVGVCQLGRVGEVAGARSVGSGWVGLGRVRGQGQGSGSGVRSGQ